MPGLNSSHSVTKDFNTKLENGVMDKKTAQITFNSPNQIIGKNLLRTIGSATGLGIKINNITFGSALALTGLYPDVNVLLFTVVKNMCVIQMIDGNTPSDMWVEGVLSKNGDT